MSGDWIQLSILFEASFQLIARFGPCAEPLFDLMLRFLGTVIVMIIGKQFSHGSMFASSWYAMLISEWIDHYHPYASG